MAKNYKAKTLAPNGVANAIGLVINNAHPLSTLNGGTGTSHTFTQGSVVFCGVGGNFTEANTQLFVSSNTNYLNGTFVGPILQSPYYYTVCGGV